jgi:hypothetical protein
MKPHTGIQEKETLPDTGTITLPAPKRGFQYVEVPEDLSKHVFNLPGLYSLCRLENGGILEDLDAHLSKVVGRAMTMQKKGTVSLAITLKPEGIKNMEIIAKVDSKPPKIEPSPTMLFATEKGQLLAHDPAQLELSLNVIRMAESDTERRRRKVIDEDD